MVVFGAIVKKPQPQESCFFAWRSLRVIDIEMLDRCSRLDPLAFAAIIDMADEAPRSRNLSLSAFPYNSQFSVQQNIMTRPGVLAINDEDRRKREKLPDIHWRLLEHKLSRVSQNRAAV